MRSPAAVTMFLVLAGFAARLLGLLSDPGS
jgi:hypothetical protein